MLYTLRESLNIISSRKSAALKNLKLLVSDGMNSKNIRHNRGPAGLFRDAGFATFLDGISGK